MDSRDDFRQTRDMKRPEFVCAVLYLLLLTPIARGDDEVRHVFLLIGQSNMAGRAAIEDVDREPIPAASLWDLKQKQWVQAVPPYNLFSRHRKDVSMQRLNCGPSFVRAYRQAFPGVKVGIVCAARGGTSIEQWGRGRREPWPLYDTAITVAREALASEPSVLRGVLWHQGEANSGRPDEYPELLAQLITNLRTDLQRPQLPVVFSQIGSWRDDYRPFNEMIVRQPMQIPHTACVDTTGLRNMDAAHFDSPGQRELGRRYARLMMGLLKPPARRELRISGPIDLSETWSPGRSVATGEFRMHASLTLPRVDGTAASVWLGGRLNFGFDGRSGTLFVEGPAIPEGPKMLAPVKEHISAGKPFQFSVHRDASGQTAVKIDQTVVFQTRVLAGEAISFRFRPHRNKMRVASLLLQGDLGPIPPPLEVRTPVMPLLLGSQVTLAELDVTLADAAQVTGMSFSFDGTNADGELSNIALSADDGSQFAAADPVAMPLAVRPGQSRLRLVGTLSEACSLRKLFRVRLESVTVSTASGSRTLRPSEPHVPTSLRPAFAIHRRGERDCHTTRIPGIARTKQGTLLAVYDMRYNGRRDLQEHIDIGLSRSTDNGQTWEPPRPIMDMGEYGGKPQKENGCSDPNILVDRETGEILVSAVWTHGKPNTHQWVGRGSEPGFDIHRSSQFMMVRSGDDGVTWSKPENLTRRLKNEKWWLFAPAPGNGITLTDGTLVMPTQGRDEVGFPFSNLMFSRDHGRTWTLGTAARDNTTECAVAELSDGSLMLNMRDNRNRADKSDTNGRAVGVTNDLGRSWQRHATDHGALPEPVCMASLISHRRANGQHLLVFSNPNTKRSRTRMTVQFSFDDGLTWPAEQHVLLDERGGAYSSLVVLDDETVGILYESSQANLVYQVVPIPKGPVKSAATRPISRVLFGSCIRQNLPVPILDTVVDQAPDAFIFLGDNIYGDTEDMSVLKARYAKLAAAPGFQRLREACRVLATWDDHDYGVNDGGAAYSQREASQRVFLDFWKVPPDSVRRTRPGIYDACIVGPPGKRVQFILLDTRYFRSPLKRGARRVGGSWMPDENPRLTMLGEDQWSWLEAQLREEADVRILASSIQLVASDAGQETWSNLPRERERLFGLIRETGAAGLVVISGDRHWSELSAVRQGVPYPLYDLTSSSLNQVHPRGTPTVNRFRVSETTWHMPNFGQIDIDWDRRRLVLRIRNADGKSRIRQTIPLSDLQPTP